MVTTSPSGVDIQRIIFCFMSRSVHGQSGHARYFSGYFALQAAGQETRGCWRAAPVKDPQSAVRQAASAANHKGHFLRSSTAVGRRFVLACWLGKGEPQVRGATATLWTNQTARSPER